MLKKQGFIMFIAVTAIAVTAFTGLKSSKAEETAVTKTITEVAKPATDMVKTDGTDVAAMMTDRVLGDENAPVTILEFASLTCGHCAAFHNERLPEVKKELIETGKVKLILREFPLDGIALKASMMLRCAPADKYYKLAEVVFANQTRWARSPDPLNALTKYGMLAGLSKTKIQACMNNKDLEKAILAGLQAAQQQYTIQATPTFIFNDGAERMQGVHAIEDIKATVEKLIAK